jgi:hypothetical protein
MIRIWNNITGGPIDIPDIENPSPKRPVARGMQLCPLFSDTKIFEK